MEKESSSLPKLSKGMDARRPLERNVPSVEKESNPASKETNGKSLETTERNVPSDHSSLEQLDLCQSPPTTGTLGKIRHMHCLRMHG